MKTSIFLILIVFSFLGSYSQDDKSNCEITFSFNLQDNQLSSFQYKVINGTDRITSYFWDFGDGYTSQLANPNHVFLNEGTYLTCLTVVFENNCIATYCDSIVVDNPLIHPDQNYGLSGYVYAGNAFLPNGIVVLFKKINNQFKAISFTKITDGFYSFSNLSPSQYWLYAIPYFNINTLFYPNYFPTYYGNTLLWQDAIPITVTSFHAGKNIQLLQSFDLYIGADTVTGTMIIADSTTFEYNVYLNNWFDSTLPPQEHLNLAPNQVILLADANNKVQRFALTDHYGRFAFTNIPKQIVKLKPEKCGVVSQTLSLNVTQFNDVIFILNPTNISINVNENSSSSIVHLNLYPNPANTFVFVKVQTSSPSSDISIELINMQGQIIYQQKFTHHENETYLLPLTDLPNGPYLINVRTKDEIARKGFLKL